jgi:DNA gyrase/topoisomerase IV subunit B
VWSYIVAKTRRRVEREVIDNSVDEALAGYAKRIDVVLFADGSRQVSDA